MVRLPRVVLLAGLAVLTAAAAPVALAGVRVVGPGQPYSQISAAVAAASDGDVILVKHGDYDGFTITNKSVAVVAEVGALVYVNAAIRIAGLTATKTVVLDRLVVFNDAVVPYEGLIIDTCSGRVRVQGCKFTASTGTAAINPQTCQTEGVVDGGTGIRVQFSQDVALVGSEGYGGAGSFVWDFDCYMTSGNPQIGGDGGTGLEVIGSRVAVYDGVFSGGYAGSGAGAGDAGHGIAILGGSSFLLVNTLATGGNGAVNQDPLTGSPGASGIFVQGADVSILDSQFKGGLSPGGTETTAAEFGVTPTWWHTQAKGLGFFKLLREGQTTPIQVAGAAGDLVMLMASTKTSAFPSAQFKGSFLLDRSLMLGPFVIGVIPQDILTVLVTMPALPAGLPVLEIYLQGLVKSVDGTSTLTSWGHLTLLDSSY